LGISSVLLVVAILFLPPAFGYVLWPIILLGALSTQIHRYRRVSTPTERQQTKWVVFGILLWLVLMGLLGIPYTLVASMPPGSALPWWALAGSTGWWLTLTIVPVSLSIAVLRYRLYHIDVVLNRALVYGSLTAMLLLVYFGGVATTQALFRALTGHERLPPARRRGLHASHRRAFRPLETPHPGVHRQALLQAQIRREKDAGGFLGPVAR
jgi:hypothetical protein